MKKMKISELENNVQYTDGDGGFYKKRQLEKLESDELPSHLIPIQFKRLELDANDCIESALTQCESFDEDDADVLCNSLQEALDDWSSNNELKIWDEEDKFELEKEE